MKKSFVIIACLAAMAAGCKSNNSAVTAQEQENTPEAIEKKDNAKAAAKVAVDPAEDTRPYSDAGVFGISDGKVKTIYYISACGKGLDPGYKSVSFTKKGVLESIEAYKLSGKDSLSATINLTEACFSRDDNKRLISIEVPNESYDAKYGNIEFEYSKGNYPLAEIVTYSLDGATYISRILKKDNNHNATSVMKISTDSSDQSSKYSEATIKYQYPEFDHHGNWTLRTDSKGNRSVRVIAYYDEPAPDLSVYEPKKEESDSTDVDTAVEI